METQKKEIDETKLENKKFHELSQMLQEVITERKAETARYEEKCKELQKQIELLKHKFGEFRGSNFSTRCIYENLRPEDLNKPMGISCPCPRCVPYSMQG